MPSEVSTFATSSGRTGNFTVGHATQDFVIKQGLDGEKAKEIVKAIKGRTSKFKARSRIGRSCHGKKRDDLQPSSLLPEQGLWSRSRFRQLSATDKYLRRGVSALLNVEHEVQVFGSACVTIGRPASAGPSSISLSSPTTARHPNVVEDVLGSVS
jgi:hypothetical protein